jgi:uncharacterized protein (TIGR02001 family)
MLRSLRCVAKLGTIAALCAVLVPVGFAGDRWGGSVALTTDYLLRGISQSNGAAAIQGDLHYRTPKGWFVGVWSSTVDVDEADGTTAELNLYAGHAWQPADDWSISVTVGRYAYPWNTRSQLYEYDELKALAAYRDLVFASFSLSPDTPLETELVSHRHTASSGELAVRLPLCRRISASAGVGRYSLHGGNGAAYWYWSSGLSYDFQPWQLEAGYFDASDEAWTLVDPGIPHGHWAATLLRRF